MLKSYNNRDTVGSKKEIKMNKVLEKFISENGDQNHIIEIFKYELVQNFVQNVFKDEKGRIHLEFEYKFNFNIYEKNERRKAIDDDFEQAEYILRFIIGLSYEKELNYGYNYNVLGNKIFEALKNISDRTNSDGYMKIKFVFSEGGEMMKCFITIGDNGIGIGNTLIDNKKVSNHKGVYKNSGAGLDMFFRCGEMGFENGLTKFSLFDGGILHILSMPNLRRKEWKYFEDIIFEPEKYSTQYFFEFIANNY